MAQQKSKTREIIFVSGGYPIKARISSIIVSATIGDISNSDFS